MQNCHENVIVKAQCLIYGFISQANLTWGKNGLNNKLCSSSRGNDITSLHYFNAKKTQTQRVRYEEQVYTSLSLSVNRSCLLAVLASKHRRCVYVP